MERFSKIWACPLGRVSWKLTCLEAKSTRHGRVVTNIHCTVQIAKYFYLLSSVLSLDCRTISHIFAPSWLRSWFGWLNELNFCSVEWSSEYFSSYDIISCRFYSGCRLWRWKKNCCTRSDVVIFWDMRSRSTFSFWAIVFYLFSTQETSNKKIFREVAIKSRVKFFLLSQHQSSNLHPCRCVTGHRIIIL